MPVFEWSNAIDSRVAQKHVKKYGLSQANGGNDNVDESAAA